MTRYQFTPQAVDDLFEIWSYIAQDSPESADRVEAMIFAACETLARSPFVGAIRDDLTVLPVRFWPVPSFPNYFIIYEPAAEPLRVIRVLHGARNISSLLPQE
jgi:plasmid stabilization system protein ParE